MISGPEVQIVTVKFIQFNINKKELNEKIILGSLLLSSIALAGQGSGVGKITQLNVGPDGTHIRVWFSKTVVNPSGCDAEGYYVRELDDTRGSDRLYSSILSAFMAKRDVTLYIHGCSTKKFAGNTRPRIHDIYIKE